MDQFGAVKPIIKDIQEENALFFAVYVKQNIDPYDNDEAAEHLMDEDHLDGRRGNYWSGTHPKFNPQHTFPFTAVIDLATGVVLDTDPIPELMTPDDILDTVQKANKD